MLGLRRVDWRNQLALNPETGFMECVTVVLWDYEQGTGKALARGLRRVDVYVTDYMKGDLTIGVRSARGGRMVQ